MRVSKDKVNKFLEKELFRMLHQTIADLRSPQEVESFFKVFLFEAEHTTLAKRLGVAYWLDKGRSYDNIHTNLKVSSATISTMSSSLNSEGVKAALQKVKADEWAAVWVEKIQKFVKRS